MQARGAEGFDLHGGACKGDGSWYRELAYECRNGHMHVNLLAMGVSLGGATAPGQGGYVIVPGSHKSNFPVPDGVQHLEGDMLGLLHNPALEAGDVLLFTEAATHGAVPWSGGGGGDREGEEGEGAPSAEAAAAAAAGDAAAKLDAAAEADRTVALFRFAPATMGYGRAYLEGFGLSDEARSRFSPEEAAVIAPPYHNRLDRVCLAATAPSAEGAAAQQQQQQQQQQLRDFHVHGHQTEGSGDIPAAGSPPLTGAATGDKAAAAAGGGVATTVPFPRKQEKKDFDHKCFNSPYF